MKSARGFQSVLREPDMIFPGEEIVHISGYHWIYVLKAFLPLLLILVGGTIVWSLVPTRLTSAVIVVALLASMVWIVLKILDTMIKRCFITNRRLINRSGWTKRDTQDVTLDRIGGIFLDQTPIERLLGYGRIRLIVPVIQIPLPQYLRNPVAFRNALYLKAAAKAPEKPDDDAMTEEHDRQAREEDDRFGTETVSLKEVQEITEDIDGESLGADLGAELGADAGSDLGSDVDDAALIEAEADVGSDVDSSTDDGGGDAGDDGTT